MGLAAVWLLTAAAGAGCAGLVRVPLRLEERAALALVMGVVAASVVSLLLGLALGTSALVAILGPALVVAAVAVVARRTGAPGPAQAWRESWLLARGALRERDTWVLGALTVFAAVGFWRLFAHTLFTDSTGGISAGFATVWADWSLHSTLASSFSVAGNMPPHDPIFSGGSLRYPFLPDFHSGLQEAAGASVDVALALPCAVLCTAATLLVVSLGRRLSGSLAPGILAILLCLAGGSLGWTRVWWDACTASGRAAADCGPGTALTHPDMAISVLRSVPGVVAAQGRNYDNLENPGDAQLTSSAAVQWYTPLLAWWLPQRSFVYGFATGVAVLLLAVAGMRAPPGTRSPFVAAGLLAGLLPLIHIHTLIALAVVLGIWALMRRRREWLWLAGAAALLAVPRVLQVAGSGTGTSDPSCPAGGTRFPYFEVGWMSQAPSDPCSRPGFSDFTFSGAVTALGRLVRLPFSGDFWVFWLDNNGVLIVVVAVLVLLALVAALPGFVAWLRGDDVERAAAGAPAEAEPPPPGALDRVGAGARRLAGVIPAELLRACLPFVAVFVLANVVVFQTWDWDNTKILAWWYLGAALLVGAWIAAMWRRGGWRAFAASAALVSLVLGAGLSLTRILQQEHAADGGGGPYQWASAADVALASTVAARTAEHAVFLIPANDPTDPVLTLAGRTALLGYEGWLYSYGVDTGMRPTDRDTVYRGCEAGTDCPIPGLLARYGIQYVVVPHTSSAQPWFMQAYPSVASSDGSTVFDVRSSPRA